MKNVLITGIVVSICFLTNMVQGQVLDWSVGKIRLYRQVADDTAPTTPISWALEVWLETTNAGDATSATISGGGLSSPLVLEKDGSDWELWQEYGSEAALDADFPNGGSYTLTLSGGSLGTLTQTFTMGAKNYPNIPYLTGVDYTRAQSMDASQSYQLHWNAANATANTISVEAYLRPDEAELADEEFDVDDGPLPQSMTIPANTFSPGTANEALVSFLHYDEFPDTGGFGVEGYFDQEQLTLFEVHPVLSSTPQAIVGAWQFGDGAADDSGVLVFLANGVYFFAQDTVADTDWQDGIERGTYTWDAQTGALSVLTNAASDTNGEIGLSHPNGSYTVTVSGDTLTMADADGPFELARVGFDGANPIEGAWPWVDNKGNITACFVFLANNVYFQMEVFSADGSNGNPDTSGASGMERGTYSYNAGNGRLEATSIAVDTNGEYGLSHLTLGYMLVDFYGPRVMNMNDMGEHEPQILRHRASNASVMPYWRWNKSRAYSQTADNTAPSAPTYWNAWSIIETRNPEDAATITISGGGISGSISYTRDGNEWEMDRDYGSEAALDAEFPSGAEYTITLSGGALGTLVQKLNVEAKNHPSAPYLTGSLYNDVQALDPTQDLSLQWSNPVVNGGGSTDFNSTRLEIYADSEGSGVQYYFWNIDAPMLSRVVPAQTLLIGGNEYEGYLELGNAVDVSGLGGLGPLGNSAHHSILEFPIQTLTPSDLAASFAEDAGLVGDDTLPLATPHDDGVENLVKFAFNMDLSGPDTSTMTPETGDSGLPVFEINDDGPSTVFQVEFVRRKGAGLVYTAKRSSTLTNGSFTPMTGAVTVTPINDQFERVSISEPCDPATTPRCFGRVEVTLP